MRNLTILCALLTAWAASCALTSSATLPDGKSWEQAPHFTHTIHVTRMHTARNLLSRNNVVPTSGTAIGSDFLANR
jgi:hypothetical protein